MAKLAIFDKDGTLVDSTAASGFINQPDQQIIRPGSLEIVKNYLDNDYILCVASNQGGVEKNHKSLQTAIDEMLYCNNLYVEALGHPVFERFYFCPDFDGNICYLGEPGGYMKDAQNWKCQPFNVADSVAATSISAKGRFRKPNSGMLEMAIYYYTQSTNYGIDPNYKLEDVVMIGDRPEDEQAANKICKFRHIDSF
jgi:histidinol phosphatase-like enzyme